jgi:cytochrome P450
MKALLEHPEQWRELREGRSLITQAVEEILRWATPVMYMRRTALRDTQIGGQPIKENDKVIQWYVSGNRDPELNLDPDRFDIKRREVRHLSFGGGGKRFCLGNSPSRLEQRVLFEEVARRMLDIEQTAKPRWLRSNWFSGLTTMPIRFSPGRTEMQ